ncbi:MAG: phosphoribosylglycinamide formyltransferase [Coxiella sp. RIFCSPHIGHO2_12_FULL_42_15]|nr:MAG: phosphoribosylglycinamide formyltransferase [Coxiella sp. RIFCSPHIGHO2_12_FULL_42_15]
MAQPLSLVVLISGNGSNLQAIIDAIAQHQLQAEIKAVISNKVDAYGLTRAEKAHIPTRVFSRRDYPDQNAFDNALLQAIAAYSPNLVVLAGFMHKLGPALVRYFMGRMINIHPSLLPKYPGLHTHQRVLEAKDQRHGVSIHFVTEELDAGPIISQMSLSVRTEDTAESLQQRVLQLEHRLYPETLRWFEQKRINFMGGKIWMDGKPLSDTGCRVD